MAANWTLQLSIFVFAVNVISVPYNASIVAHEKMSAFAYISIFEVSLKLAIAYLLLFISYDKLICIFNFGILRCIAFTFPYICFLFVKGILRSVIILLAFNIEQFREMFCLCWFGVWFGNLGFFFLKINYLIFS